ncbi:hypothetical protein BESB_051990 [Besnoitia besnoiti]|uniref:Glutaredoxin domain-containing protein n=1 Tax=Besnoitia besnoiti TaxID=94643 RepID=A0A2A9MAP2_BESBE|nr:hypothetical protein BESB_051990 [Besnoitia besnoiti]PFH35548.1 hypothetical protein BESB_051990 [Besnoitia besnoiti]
MNSSIVRLTREALGSPVAAALSVCSRLPSSFSQLNALSPAAQCRQQFGIPQRSIFACSRRRTVSAQKGIQPTSSGVRKQPVPPQSVGGRRFLGHLATRYTRTKSVCGGTSLMFIGTPSRSNGTVSAPEQSTSTDQKASRTVPPHGLACPTVWYASSQRTRLTRKRKHSTPHTPAPAACFVFQGLKKKLDDLVKSTAVVLFMKGSPQAPMCGFSARAVGILNSLEVEEYTFVDILQYPDVRAVAKKHFNWPTYPLLVVGGAVVGGVDIMEELNRAGELEDQLKKALTACREAESVSPAADTSTA